MVRSWTRGIVVVVFCGAPLGLWARTSGPDASGLVLIDSAEDDGPPHTWVDASVGMEVSPGLVGLPFPFSWGESLVDAAHIHEDGSILFSGDVTGCPGAGTWSGIASSGVGSVRHRVIGRYPNRGLMWDWETSQVTLLEHRSEVIIRVDSSEDDDIIGAQAGSGTGVPWACTDGSTLGERSAWISDSGGRSVSALRSTGDLDHAWWGSRAAEFFGESIAVGDVNGDGLTDVLVGEPEGDTAFLFYGHRADSGAESEDASMMMIGTPGGRLGHAVAMADLDADGLDDLIVSAPTASGGGSVHVFLAADGLDGLVDAGDASSVVSAPDGLGSAGLGSSLAVADVSGDGGLDVVMGAPNARSGSVPMGGVWVARDRVWTEPIQALSSDDGWFGDAIGAQAGEAVAVADFDDDGVAEIVVSVPYADTVDDDAGQVFILAGDAPAGTIDGAASLRIDGVRGGGLLGTSLATGNLDGVGGLDLVIGAVGLDEYGPRTGAVFIFLDPAATMGAMTTDDASRVISGAEGAQAVGASVSLGSLDDDDTAEILVGATGGVSALGGGGMVAVFRGLPLTDVSIADADHRLFSPDGGGELGTAVVVAADLQGNGYPDLVVAAPLDTPGVTTGAGAVWVWPFLPAYLDADGDGFVAHISGGLDCDDGNEEVNPNQVEIVGNLRDDDCDGWVDDVFIARPIEDGWRFDLLDVLGVDDTVLFDFEDTVDGAVVGDLYATRGLTLGATGALRAQDDVWGSAPVGVLGARVTAGGDANDLILSFGAPIDAVGMRVLDAEVLMRMDAAFEGELVLDGFQFYADGPDTPGGVFQGFTFASPVDTVRIAASTPNGFGVDNIEVIFAAESDRDGDGLSAADGDCDDFDSTVLPGAEEVFGDGVDNDCDGVVDGGVVDVFLSEGSFVSAVSIIGDKIDFESPALGEMSSAFYADRGVHFSGEVVIVEAVGSTPPIDAQAALIATEPLVLNFTENQPALAFWLLDPVGVVSIEARRDGLVMYSTVLPEGTAGFVGMAFPVPVDTLLLHHTVSGDAWGMDDLILSALGLDDADGDGFTEADGDCDDAESGAYPGADEVWYDGIDGDCDGADDFDADGDGHSSAMGGGFDCDDLLAAVYPGAEDDWYDGVDSDCAGDDDFDSDGDGHSSSLYGGSDCDDSTSAVSPDAAEVFYDDVDDDCDPTTDYDADGDGYAAPGFPGALGFYGVGDCDDLEGGTHPGAEETWYDGIDSDCGGDDDYDSDGDGHIPLAYGGDDCDDDSSGSSPDALFDECYDGLDTDCDAHSDFDCDRDGYDDVAYGGWDCDDTDGTVFPGDGTTADGPDLDCDGFVPVEAGGEDCDDADPDAHPGATDVWYDGRDDDCDGADDYDRDGDGYRVTAWAEDPEMADCVDTDPLIHPGMVDDCGGGDEDCDGEVDEDCLPMEDSAVPSDDGATGDAGGGGVDESLDDPVEDTGSSEEGDTGEVSEPGSGDTASETEPGSTGESTADEIDIGSASPGKPGKVAGCGCYSAAVPSSWGWLVPLWVAVVRRRNSN